MRETVARCVVTIGVGLTLMAVQGCKKHAAPAPVQPVVVSSARGVQPDFPIGPLPVEDVDTGARPRVERAARPRYQAQPVGAEGTDAQAAAASAAQKRQDERLFQQQEAASQRQQEELNRDIEENVKMQQEMQAEPRIQDTPGGTPPQPQ